jgi:F-type H+-transporting ATPase subunit epsilon
MIDDFFTLNIVSVEGIVFNGEVNFLKFIAPSGEIGILKDHAPMLTLLLPGPIRYQGTVDGVISCSGGLVEVKSNHVTILADNCVRAEDLDEASILEVKAKAEELLKERKDSQSFHEAYTELVRSSVLLKSVYELKHLRGRKKT